VLPGHVWLKMPRKQKNRAVQADRSGEADSALRERELARGNRNHATLASWADFRDGSFIR